jgi:hypothetical protein
MWKGASLSYREGRLPATRYCWSFNRLYLVSDQILIFP